VNSCESEDQMAGFSGKINILLVEPDSRLLDSTAKALRDHLPEASQVRQARAAREAMAWFDRERFQAVLVNQDLPDGKGTTLIRAVLMLRGRHTSFFLVGASARADDEDIVHILRDHPQVTFIERPYLPEIVARQICAAVHPHSATDQSFYGLRLCELIQAYCIGRRSATLVILFPDGRMGTVHIREGELVHATFAHHDGTEALRRMVECQKGEIRVTNGCPTARRTLTRPAQQILLDIYRQIDEQRRTDISSANAPSSPRSSSPSPSAGTAGATPPTPPSGSKPRSDEEELMAEIDSMFVPGDQVLDLLGGPEPAPSASEKPLNKAPEPALAEAQAALQAKAKTPGPAARERQDEFFMPELDEIYDTTSGAPNAGSPSPANAPGDQRRPARPTAITPGHAQSLSAKPVPSGRPGAGHPAKTLVDPSAVPADAKSGSDSELGENSSAATAVSPSAFRLTSIGHPSGIPAPPQPPGAQAPPKAPFPAPAPIPHKESSSTARLREALPAIRKLADTRAKSSTGARVPTPQEVAALPAKSPKDFLEEELKKWGS